METRIAFESCALDASRLQDQRCVGELKNMLMKFAKDNGIMKILTKRGYVRSKIVAA